MHAKTINLLCKGNKVFVKYQAQGEDLTTIPFFAYALELNSFIPLLYLDSSI